MKECRHRVPSRDNLLGHFFGLGGNDRFMGENEPNDLPNLLFYTA